MTLKRNIRLLSASPILTNGSYNDGDVMGSVFQISDVVLADEGNAILDSIMVTDKDQQNVDFDLYLFDQALTNSPGADSAPFLLTDTDLDKMIGGIQLYGKDYTNVSAGSSQATYAGLNLVLQANTGAQDLFGLLVRRQPLLVAASVWTSPTNLALKLGFSQG